jgi:hypothetical protein
VPLVLQSSGTARDTPGRAPAIGSRYNDESAKQAAVRYQVFPVPSYGLLRSGKWHPTRSPAPRGRSAACSAPPSDPPPSPQPLLAPPAGIPARSGGRSGRALVPRPWWSRVSPSASPSRRLRRDRNGIPRRHPLAPPVALGPQARRLPGAGSSYTPGANLDRAPDCDMAWRS